MMNIDPREIKDPIIRKQVEHAQNRARADAEAAQRTDKVRANPKDVLNPPKTEKQIADQERIHIDRERGWKLDKIDAQIKAVMLPKTHPAALDFAKDVLAFVQKTRAEFDAKAKAKDEPTS